MTEPLPSAHVLHQLQSFLIQTGRWHDAAAHLTPAYPLIENEVLDSLGIFELVAFIEAQFGIEVEDDDLVVENFECIRAIGSMVEDKVSP